MNKHTLKVYLIASTTQIYPDIFCIAIEISKHLSDNLNVRIVPDSDGGIVFQYGNSKIHVWDDGTIDGFVFENCKVINRQELIL